MSTDNRAQLTTSIVLPPSVKGERNSRQPALRDPRPRIDTSPDRSPGPEAGDGVDIVLAEAFVGLASGLDDTQEPDLPERLLGAVTKIFDTCACVALADDAGKLSLRAWTGDTVRALGQQEIDAQEGALWKAFRTSHLFETTPEEEGTRPVASTANFRHVWAFPISSGERSVGVVLFAATHDVTLSQHQSTLLSLLISAASLSLAHRKLHDRSLQLQHQLQMALDSRVLIEQAKGYLAAQLKLSVDDAFQLLRVIARNQNRKLSEVATAAVNGMLWAGKPKVTPERR